MIYIRPPADAPIAQGDIFREIPRMDVSLRELAIVRDDGTYQTSWMDLVQQGETGGITAVVAMKPVHAIVITQDCDAVRSPDIALCEIMDFKEVEHRLKDMKETPKKWVGVITQHARINQKWYYLPVGPEFGFRKKMGVDFRSVIRIARPDLEAMRQQFRIGRLNAVALAHFRERVGEFFRRFPYDEWYPLNKEELEAYRRQKPEPIQAYDWQK